MGVYFALRTHYDYPTGKYLRYFPECESVLAWFQRYWQGRNSEDDTVPGYDYEILGCNLYGFNSLFEAIAEHNLAPPKTMRQLSALLNEHLYVEGEILISANAIQVLTDDDELELAYYFFDDHYLAKEPEKAAYLLLDDWELPTNTEPSSAGKIPALPTSVKTLPAKEKGSGAVYAVFLSFYDSCNLDDLEGAYRIPGVRLPQLTTYLRDSLPHDDWVTDLELLRALTAVPEGASENALQDVLTEAATIPLGEIHELLYKLDFGKGTPAEDRVKLTEALLRNESEEVTESSKRSLVQVEEHVAQLCLHASTWNDPSGEMLLY